MQEKYDKLIQNFKKYTEANDHLIFNHDLLDIKIDNVKFIVVGDNPGQDERVAHRYLIGAAGKMARSFFKANLDTDFKNEVIVLNKSAISTDKTQGLKDYYFGDLCFPFISNQKYMAHLIYLIHKLKNVPVLIMGYSNYCKNGKWEFSNHKSGRPLAYFFDTLHFLYKDEPEFSDNLLFIKHFSMGRFHSEYKNTHYEGGTPLEKLTYIGKKNIAGFFD